LTPNHFYGKDTSKSPLTFMESMMQLCDEPMGKHAIKAIVFDFDNVIVRQSEQCKKDAWSSVFKHGSVEMERIGEGITLFQGGKGDRFDILGHVYDLPHDTNVRLNESVLLAAGKYDAIVQSCILGIGIVGSDLHTLLSLHKSFPLYVISATPEESLHTTMRRLGELYTVDLLTLFKLALGTPKNKVENFRRVQEQSGISVDKMLMVGDGENDYSAARDVGTQFVGINTNENRVRWRDRTFSKINSISELGAQL